MRMDIRVYRRYRKHPFIPDYETSRNGKHETVSNAPVFVVSAQRLDDIAQLESDDLIRQHCREPLLVFTDRQRLLAGSPEGYDYLRYTCVIDAETAREIISRL
ncbi:hypothetical protein ACFFK0_15640 [Paenibacillus chartarius]|uniref:Uncharacterized protein n=1 Tax=Paenibacillus chartarius TaxID=747481 RepID=A0ABV6DMI8_9BACL